MPLLAPVLAERATDQARATREQNAHGLFSLIFCKILIGLYAGYHRL
jgi:hypothetical protein